MAPGSQCKAILAELASGLQLQRSEARRTDFRGQSCAWRWRRGEEEAEEGEVAGREAARGEKRSRRAEEDGRTGRTKQLNRYNGTQSVEIWWEGKRVKIRRTNQRRFSVFIIR